MENAHKGSISVTCSTMLRRSRECHLTSDTEMICIAPPLCSEDKAQLNSILNTTRKRREAASSVASKFVPIDMYLHLDGVERKYSINYFNDPGFALFTEDNRVKVFDSSERKLVILGTNLNLVAGKGDVVVTVGVDKCDVIELRETNLTCVAPTNQPAPSIKGASLPEVNVSIGNIHANVGYLRYKQIQELQELSNKSIIIAAVLSIVLAIGVSVAVVVLILKYKNTKMSQKMKACEKQVEETELEMRLIVQKMADSTNEPHYVDLDTITTASDKIQTLEVSTVARAADDTQDEYHEYNTVDGDDDLKAQEYSNQSLISNTDKRSKVQDEDDGYLNPASETEYLSPVPHFGYLSPVPHFGTKSDNNDYLSLSG